jgi:hypothetical protein
MLQPFTIAVPDAVLADLSERRAATRLPAAVRYDDWNDGTSRAYLRDILAYWRGGGGWDGAPFHSRAWMWSGAIAD